MSGFSRGLIGCQRILFYHAEKPFELKIAMLFNEPLAEH